MGKRFRSVSARTMQLLQNYAWPGNVRELQNVVERAVIVADGEIFHVDASWFTRPAPPSRASASFSADLAEREKGMIEEALRHTKGLISGPAGAAARLGLPRQTLESKIRKLGIERYRFRES
jgi:formate hydrogenlyase transcriptional activator